MMYFCSIKKPTTMQKHLFFIMLSIGVASAAMAQPTVMTVTDCMRYAVEHNHDVRIGRLTQDSRHADRTAAIGAWLPSIGASIGVQYNFGRAIDPETNTYTNVNTFYNGFAVQASLPVFDGFQRLNQLRATRAALLKGESQQQVQRDELCLQVFEAYCNVLYYNGTRTMAAEKREQSRMILRQTQVMVEVGQKSEADVAQMEAQLAADDYEVTRQENELTTAWLTLKQLMGYPSTPTSEQHAPEHDLPTSTDENVCQPEEAFVLQPIAYATATPEAPSSSSSSSAAALTGGQMAVLQAAQHNVSQARYNLRIARGNLSPSLSLSGGWNTTYYKMLHAAATPYAEQLRGNRGEYIYASVNIPVFNRLQTVSNIRRQRNNLRIAEEQLAQQRDELTRLQLQAENDCEGYRKQTLQMQKKVVADSLASQLTLRKYAEGLASGIDVQTTAATLLQSRAGLLQCQLMLALKQQLVNYYNGTSLWIE